MDTNQMIPESHPLHRLFRGLAESTFMDELGIGDPKLVGYLSNLLAEFVRVQPAWQLGDRDSRTFSRILAMAAEAEAAEEETQRREIHRQVGDFTLFWTGVFPEILTKLQGKNMPDPLVRCQEQGKRSYYLASLMDETGGRNSVLRRLSDQFELCAFGLSRVRKEWEKLEGHGGPTWR